MEEGKVFVHQALPVLNEGIDAVDNVCELISKNKREFEELGLHEAMESFNKINEESRESYNKAVKETYNFWKQFVGEWIRVDYHFDVTNVGHVMLVKCVVRENGALNALSTPIYNGDMNHINWYEGVAVDRIFNIYENYNINNMIGLNYGLDVRKSSREEFEKESEKTMKFFINNMIRRIGNEH